MLDDDRVSHAPEHAALDSPGAGSFTTSRTVGTTSTSSAQPSSTPRRETGIPDDERDTVDRVIGSQTVRPQPMLAEELAVVRGHDDEGLLMTPSCLDLSRSRPTQAST